MGCCQSDQHEHNVKKKHGCLQVADEDVQLCNFERILTFASQEHLEDLEKCRSIFESVSEEIKAFDYNKALINTLIETNTKIVTSFLHEVYKMKIESDKLEQVKLRLCPKQLEHQPKACSVFHDNDSYLENSDDEDNNYTVSALCVRNALAANPLQIERHVEVEQIIDEKTEQKRIEIEQENEDRFKLHKMCGKVIDQLVKEKSALEDQIAEIKRQLEESSDNKDENEWLKWKEKETFRRMKMIENELEDAKKDKNSFIDLVEHLVKKETVSENKLVNKTVDLQRRLKKANKFKTDIKQKTLDFYIKHRAERQQWAEQLVRLKDLLKENENTSAKYQTLVATLKKELEEKETSISKFKHEMFEDQTRIHALENDVCSLDEKLKSVSKEFEENDNKWHSKYLEVINDSQEDIISFQIKRSTTEADAEKK